MSKKNYSLLMRSLDIPQFHNISELSNLIGVSESLLFCLSNMSWRYYRRFNVCKKNGGKREIFAPSYMMQIIQRWILVNILNKIQPSNQAMAFRKGREYGCKANALFHLETHYGVSIDLKDFFPSINSSRIYTVFSNIGYDSFAAAILTNLCTIDGYLPQGGPCSPALSNLVCLALDARLNGFCEKRRIRFSRYADDMYFSCDNKDILKKSIPIIRKVIIDEGFIINDNKVHYHTPSNRKMITGIVISHPNSYNGPKIYAKKDLKRKIRSEILKMIFSGDYSEKDHVLGEISYVNYLETDYLLKVKKYICKISEQIRYFPELVNAFNDNLIFKDIRNINIIDIKDEDPMYIEYLYQKRKDYLEKRAIHDICNYEKWNSIVYNRLSTVEICVEEDNDLPF